jgi:hypothetical protein
LFGISAAAAALTKAVVVLYPAVFIAVLILSRMTGRSGPSRPRPSWAAIAAIFVAMFLTIAPWTARNYRATGGHFVLISSGFSDAFLRGYIFSKTDYALLRRPPYVDAENETNAWFRSIGAAEGVVLEQDDYQTEKVLGRAAKKKLIEEPLLFVRKSLVGLFTFWYQMTSLTNSLIVGLAALAAWTLALAGAWRAWHEAKPIWLFILPALHLNLLLAVLLALGRYSAPVMPSLLVASGYGADWLLSRLTGTSAA